MFRVDCQVYIQQNDKPVHYDATFCVEGDTLIVNSHLCNNMLVFSHCCMVSIDSLQMRHNLYEKTGITVYEGCLILELAQL